MIEPLEISEESEPMDIDEFVESLSEMEEQEEEIGNLDKLINNLAQKEKEGEIQ